MRLTTTQLNHAFVDALGQHVVHVDDITAPALTLELAPPLPQLVRVYLFNATNPQGGRVSDEHKIQLRVPGQARGARGNFDFSGGRSVILAGKVEDDDEFVLWDGTLYHDFTWSGNVQVLTATIEAARNNHAVATQQRRRRLGPETVIATPTALLADALQQRFAAGGPAATAVPPPAPAPPAAPTGGRAYIPPPRNQPEEPTTRVFEVDPDAIDRGTTAHKDTQDALAAALTARGIEALSPDAGDPKFDVAWKQKGVAYVTEVKSLTEANEERQLRLGLGQVLTYVHLLDWPHATEVRGVLAVERPPTAAYWTNLCAKHGVTLTWPEAYDELLIDDA